VADLYTDFYTPASQGHITATSIHMAGSGFSQFSPRRSGFYLAVVEISTLEIVSYSEKRSQK